MPIIPEKAMKCDDLVSFDKMLSSRHNGEITDEYLEAYKYVFSKPGFYTNFSVILIKNSLLILSFFIFLFFLTIGAFTAAINYYRANFSFKKTKDDNNDQFAASKPKKIDGSNGMFVLGERDKYISPKSLQLTAKEYPKMRVEVVPKASHFLQHHAATATNDLIRDFLGPSNEFTIQTLN